ncbi:MAG: type II CRISPR-associated endonuclease Cas1 [Paludibacteraceae bacterium]|nr:type II CRISPR-associated endonuclease Cas1 [Paludibacteraceae bacterium]
MVKRVLCFQNPAYLSLKNEQIIIRFPEIDKCDNLLSSIKDNAYISVPIEDTGIVILDNKQVTITQGLMARLLENNVAIITCDDRHLPIGLHLPLESNTIQHERWQAQINASEPLRKQMWQQTVVSKILGQAAVLQTEGVECGNMRAWAKEVRSGDTENLEGRAAAYYWRTVFHNPDFVRGQEGLPPNNLLNYGYAIVRALMARALVAAGLLPTLGIHHHNRYNAYCLADDIMEPYRPYVDMAVLQIMHSVADISEVTPALKRQLLGIPTMDVLIDGHCSPLMVAVQTTANSVQKCFAGESRKIVYPDW